jgi:hypothetical protein
MEGRLITQEMMRQFYALPGATKKLLRWRMNKLVWARCCAEIRRTAYVVELDPQTKKLPDAFLGVPVFFGEVEVGHFVLEEDPMDYDAMPAGPELDRLIAAKVMGWTLYHYTKSRPGHWEWITAPPCADVPIRIACGSVRGYFTEADALSDFAPSTNIAHAFEVVEHLQMGFKGKRQLYLQTDGYGSEKWMASWHRPEEYVTMAENEADTAPLAICRAALKAVAG